MAQAVKTRTGGRLVAETLEALGAEVAFGVPGVHALAIWDGLRDSSIRTLGLRTELNAGFAADGYARVSGRPAVLLLSTGPGALVSLAALMEAATAYVPVVAIASQIPRDLIGQRRGYLHELADQAASFAPIVKSAARARSHEEIPALLAEAWIEALTPPTGPVFVEVPVDLLQGETRTATSPTADVAVDKVGATPEQIAEAVRLLDEAERPVLWAGGGLLRSSAWEELAELARRLDAPVATTYMGKGAFPADDPLSVGSGCDEGAFKELLEEADVVLAVGTELGAETTAQYRLTFSGPVIQIDAAPERFGPTYPVHGLTGDARWLLDELLRRVGPRRRDGAARAAAARERIAAGLAEQDREFERGVLETIRAAVPRDAITTWDMTILAYWAASHFPVFEPRTFLYPLGSGTLGYAWPAALGASLAARDTPVLAVVGDGGFLYGIQELAAASQYALNVALLVVDDGGYGILREYQRASFGETTAVDLEEPDFVALARSFGVRAEQTTADELGAALERALAQDGPSLIHLPALLRMWTPTA
ncbi:MAG TPA: thiamine pyrophosphate-binding protein [Gaiellaceae bacterium]|nr:thiamine pyrophosphate-binding protein [Gaiellaceae bacterium]